MTTTSSYKAQLQPTATVKGSSYFECSAFYLSLFQWKCKDSRMYEAATLCGMVAQMSKIVYVTGVSEQPLEVE